MTQHSEVDAAAMAKRAASLQVEQRHELDGEIKPQLLLMAAQCARLPFIEDKLNQAIRPRAVHPIVQTMIAIACVAVVVIAFESVRPHLAQAETHERR